MEGRLRRYACVVLALLALVGCGGGDDDDSPSNPATTSLNINGTYRGTFVSTVQPGTGTVQVQFLQAVGNGTVTGTVAFSGSPCFRSGTVTGQLSGTSFQGTVDFGGGIQITLMASFASNGTSGNGGYAVNQNSTGCSRDQGQFTLVRQ